MVKTLVLVRHGDAEPARDGLDGSLRQLTRAGERALEAAYPEAFASLDAATTEVWSSPAMRALQKAEVAARAIGVDDIVTHQSLYDQDVEAFLGELADAASPTVVAVGHVPFVDRLADRLLGEPHPFGKGAVLALDVSAGPEGRARMLWSLDAPDTARWDTLDEVEATVAHIGDKLAAQARAFLDDPSDEQALVDFRRSVRRVRSVLAFLAPWYKSKRAERDEAALRRVQDATNRLRDIDLFSDTVDDLVESGELGENSLLPMACANERTLELESVLAALGKKKSRRAFRRALDDLADFRWKRAAMESGISEHDFQVRFDEELDELDQRLFGLDLSDTRAVRRARHDARELHYIASRLGVVLGDERSRMSAYLDDLQGELGSLSIGADNQAMAHAFERSPRFQGVRADLGVVERDQAEVVSATISAVRRRERRHVNGDPDEGAEG